MPKKINAQSAQQKIARENITKLFEQAALRFKEDSKLSDRYVNLARKVAMKYRLKLPKELKRSFCKNCYKYLVPSVNCRIRLYKKRLIIYCLNCRNYTRIPYKN